MPKLVYDFTEGNKDLKDLLGGKGANLAEMTNIGLPVPPGFTITTEACRAYLATGAAPSELDEEVAAHLAALQTSRMGSIRDQAASTESPRSNSVASPRRQSLSSVA